MSRNLGWAALIAVSLLSVGVSAQQPTAAAVATPCSAAEHRQFDFWIGDWDVASPDGEAAGTNHIERVLGGCVLHERWSAAGGGHRGESFNIYARDGRWHQTWVDNGGLLLELAGGLRDGRMLMSGELTTAEGGTALHEISWERLESGQVRQHWRVSRDGGKTWKDLFVGIYTRQTRAR